MMVNLIVDNTVQNLQLAKNKKNCDHTTNRLRMLACLVVFSEATGPFLLPLACDWASPRSFRSLSTCVNNWWVVQSLNRHEIEISCLHHTPLHLSSGNVTCHRSFLACNAGVLERMKVVTHS